MQLNRITLIIVAAVVATTKGVATSPNPAGDGATTAVASPCSGPSCATVAPSSPSNGVQYSNGSDCEEGEEDCECQELETGTLDSRDGATTTGTVTTPASRATSTSTVVASTTPATAPVPSLLPNSSATVQKVGVAALAIVCGIFTIFL